MDLSSKSVGKVLRIFLFIAIGLNVIGLFNSYFLAFHTEFFVQYFVTFEQFTSLFFTLILIILYILYLVWLFKVHKDLRKLNPEYPTTPGGALARVIIPFYNLYGMWNVYSRMAGYFEEKQATEKFGNKLSRYIPFYYFLFFISNGLNQYISRGTVSGVANLDKVWLVSYAVDLALVIFFTLIASAVTPALQTLAKMEETQQSEEVI
ncbi:DUF4328 domain-containing protein [Mesobacillus subterraneus]|uniref:DUF4328 domain-containing protein n=1 Tax=Mesobacillus subterraneus TaxID=285983 RepID=A0A427TZ55_9BACI|nr:DUF4328 domain-containing protein [Mesobacillus subterraneus]RSD29530.1 DUF4328 domain-containing protein [Mesobacillus subterraneus]